MKGIIFDIKRFALHDGPGIRTTVFMKGCSLRCRWCHNPESILPDPQMSFRSDRCTQCGACVDACSIGAVAVRDGALITDERRCSACGRCVEPCPTGAREIIGREVTADEVIAIAARDRVFYEESGGGVTFSGGEPLVQADFLRAMLSACRDQSLNTAVDTSCHCKWNVLETIVPLTALFLCDIKHMDSAAHQEMTGSGNERILENIQALADSGAEINIRFPVIPGFNDDEANIEALGNFVSCLGKVEKIDLLPYNENGLSKSRRFDVPIQPFEGHNPGENRMKTISDRLSQKGLKVTCGG